MYHELRNKIRYIIRSKTNNSDNYDKNYIKIKLNSDDALPLKKTLELYNMINYRSAFQILHRQILSKT